MWIRSVALVILVALSTSTTRADTFEYYKDSPLRLGGGFDPLDVTDLKQGCFVFDKEAPVDGINSSAIASDIRFTIRQVKGSRELHRVLGTSASVSGHYQMFAADGATASTSQYDFTSDSISWVLTASTDFGRYRAQNIRFTEEAQKLATNDPSGLAQRCGTQVVLQVIRGVSISVVFTLNTTSETSKEEVTQDFNASFGGNMWGVSGSVKNSSSLTELIKSGELNLNVIGKGGDGMSELSELVNELKQEETVAGIKKILAGYLKNLKSEKSAIVEYQTGPISLFSPKLATPSFALYNQLIAEYYFTLNQNLGWVQRISDYLQGVDDFGSGTSQKAKEAYQKARTRTFDIASAARQCRDKYEELVRLANPKEGSKSPSLTEEQRQQVRAIEDQQQSELKHAVLGTDSSNVVAARFRVGDKRYSDPCPFDINWIDFSEFASLPRYPFDDPVIWSDPLGHAPLNFLYLRVEGESITRVSLNNPNTKQDAIAGFKENPVHVFEAMWETTVDATNRPLDLVVEVKGGKSYRIRALR